MAEAIRRRWKILSVFAVSLVVLVLAVIMTWPTGTVQAIGVESPQPQSIQPSPEQREALRQQWQRADRFLDEIGYDVEALQCTAISAETCESLYVAAHAWSSRNSDRVQQATDAVKAAGDRLANLNRQAALNPRDGQAADRLQAANRAFTDALAARSAIVAELKQTVEAMLDTQAKATIARLRENTGLPLPYRALSLTATQKTQLRQELDDHARRAAMGRSAQEAQQSLSDHQQTVARILGPAGQPLTAQIGSGVSAVLATRAKLIPPVPSDPTTLEMATPPQ